MILADSAKLILFHWNSIQRLLITFATKLGSRENVNSDQIGILTILKLNTEALSLA